MHRVSRRKLSPEQLAQKVLYFAYGSNMFQDRLESRVGRVECLGAHTLKGYELTFDTGTQYECFANVKPSKDSCEGVIYELTYEQLLQLDWYEGLYTRIKEEYKGRRLHLYISELRNEKRVPKITQAYQSALLRGCLTHDLQKSLKIIQTIALARVPRRHYEFHAQYWEEFYE